MSMRLTAIRRAQTDAPADAVVERLAEAAAKEYGITDVELFLVDYRLSALLPLLTGPSMTRPGDPAWRSFDHQSEVPAGAATYLPVSARGERMGVLRLSPIPVDAEARAELGEVAALLAHELQAAGARSTWRIRQRSPIRPSSPSTGAGGTSRRCCWSSTWSPVRSLPSMRALPG